MMPMGPQVYQEAMLEDYNAMTNDGDGDGDGDPMAMTIGPMPPGSQFIMQQAQQKRGFNQQGDGTDSGMGSPAQSPLPPPSPPY